MGLQILFPQIDFRQYRSGSAPERLKVTCGGELVGKDATDCDVPRCIWQQMVDSDSIISPNNYNQECDTCMKLDSNLCVAWLI